MRRLLVDHPWLKGLTTSDILRMRAIGDLAKNHRFRLPPGDIKLIRAFNYKVDTDISGRAFSKLPRAFPNELGDLPSEQVIRNRASFLSAFDPILIECCVNSCLAFTGSNDALDACPHCFQSRYKINPATGAAVPCRTFQYLPLIPRLVQMYRDPRTAHTLGYRVRRQSSPNNYADIFDGAHYKALKQRRVMTEHKRFQHRYFSSDTDIALGLATDGFGPFKTRKQSCWPLLVFNYNLPPSIRYHLDNMLCLGVIPGPNEPKELDSFLHPLVRELDELAFGVAAYDGKHDRPFCLRAYLLACFGDMPAVAKLMCMKGHNGKYPCRACNIIGIRAMKSTNPTKLGNTHYTPLARPFAGTEEGPSNYDPLNLPLRTHAQFVHDAVNVHYSQNSTQEHRRSLRTGINGISTLAKVFSLDFPVSFPHDFMHQVFQNVLPTLIDLWTHTNKKKTFGSGQEDYIISKTAWEAIGEACAASGNTIPARFGSRVPNLHDRRHESTAESMLLFATLIGPGLLRNQFKNEAYYQHFIFLVRLINRCCSHSVTQDDVDFIRRGFARWVETYEQLYYCYTRDRLRACSLPIHSLLHIADDIEAMGPVWCYWSFPMERFCGFLSRAQKSRRFPFSGIDRRVREIAELGQIKLLYGLTDELDLEDRRDTIVKGTKYDDYPDLVFAEPKLHTTLDSDLHRKVARYISDVTGVPALAILEQLPTQQFVVWGRMQQVEGRDGHDVIRACAVSPRLTYFMRDASFVKYWTYNSRWRWDRTAARLTDEPVDGYGRVEMFIVVDTDFLQDVCELNNVTPPLCPIVLSVISPIPNLKLHTDAKLIEYKLIGKDLASVEVVDASDIDCLVGRYKAPKPDRALYVVDRTTVVGRMDMLDDTVDQD
ncbi:Transposase family tnp2 [Ceratobasidium sp. AG-Ba]|nr:Transposase family tnp2 [Ceratobasidium sp. AG-Ba]